MATPLEQLAGRRRWSGHGAGPRGAQEAGSAASQGRPEGEGGCVVAPAVLLLPEPRGVRERCTLACCWFRGHFSWQQFRAPGGKVPVSRVEMGGQHGKLAATVVTFPEAFPEG